MKALCGFVAGMILGLVPMAAHAQEEIKVSGRVVDAAGKPVAGAEVATFWNTVKEKMTPYKARPRPTPRGALLSPSPFMAAAKPCWPWTRIARRVG